MKNRLLITLFAAVIIFSSCASIHNGYLQNSTSLNSGNFSYVKWNAKGQSTATYIIGIGGNKKLDLVNEAKQDLLTKNPLKDNQSLTNIVVSWRYKTFLGIYTTATCLVSADIVEFKK